MDIIVVLITIFFAFATIFSRKTVTASFYFLLCACGVSACFFQLTLIPLALLLVFSASFWLIVYFLFSPLLSEEVNAKPVLSKKHRLIFGISTLLVYLLISGLYLFEMINKTPVPLANEDLLEYWKLDFIINVPTLLTYLLILITSLVMVLFMTWKPNTSENKEQTHDSF